MLADHRRRDKRPAKDFAELIGRDLALIQRPSLEIPQRRFASSRLVDDSQAGWGVRAKFCQECVVGGALQHADELNVRQLGQEALDRFRFLGRSV
jgi:hypothetical protein